MAEEKWNQYYKTEDDILHDNIIQKLLIKIKELEVRISKLEGK